MRTKDMTVREQVAIRRAIASFCSEFNYTSDLRDDFLNFVRENPDKCDATAVGMSHQHLVELAEQMSNHPWELRLRHGDGRDWT